MINLLQATAPAPQAGGGYSLFIMLGLMILVLYFFMWRPESKRRKQMAQFRAGLKKHGRRLHERPAAATAEIKKY